MNDMCFYHFDKVEILTVLGVASLNHILPIEIKRECLNVIINPFCIEGLNPYFKSKIIVILPSSQFFNILAQLKIEHYKVTYIEIAMDRPCELEQVAEFESYRIYKRLVKKYSSASFVYERKDIEEKYKPLCFSRKTGYFGGEFKFVLYARLSKLNHRPCIHSEWRIRKAYEIFKRTKIKTFIDLAEFDIERFFTEYTDRYLKCVEIDDEKLGKILLGWSRKKSFTERQIMSIQLASRHFMASYGISNPAELKNCIAEERQLLKHKRGPKTTWDMIIKSFKVNGVLSPVIIMPDSL